MADITLQDIFALFNATNELFKTTHEQFAENERKFQEQHEKNAREIQEMRRETERQIKETNKKIGELGNRLGDFVEYLIKPNLVQLLQTRGIDVPILHHDTEIKRDTVALEIDFLAVNDQDCVVVEVKSKLCQNDVDEHLDRMDKVKLAMPHYQHCRVIGAVAAMVISDEVAAYAMHQGLLVLAQQGDTMVILNQADFQPRIW